MIVLSLFDGISCGREALKRAGIDVDIYYKSEIDKYASAISEFQYMDDPQLGDLTKWRDWNIQWEFVDLLLAGFSCQSWSLAGKQQGDKDPRGQLMWDMLDIRDHLLEHNPNAKFLFENVKMKKSFQEYVNKAIGCEPILINSALVSAQNRNRLYWTNIEGVNQPDDLGITWGDVREHGVESESYYYTEKAMQWLARHSRSRDKILKVHNSSDKMQMIEASHGKKYSAQRFFGIVDMPNSQQSVGAMRGRYLVNGVRQDGKQLTKGLTKQYIEFRFDGKTNSLTTVSKDNVVVPFTLPNRVPADEFFFRYITVLECERLQTLDDNYSEYGIFLNKLGEKEIRIISNSQRYKCIGNGWTVDVIAHILKNL